METGNDIKRTSIMGIEEVWSSSSRMHLQSGLDSARSFDYGADRGIDNGANSGGSEVGILGLGSIGTM